MIAELLGIVMQLLPAWENPTQEATLLFAGDAMQHKAQIEAARRADGSYDYTECFTELKSIISAADYAIVNLETPIGYSNYSGYPCFNAPVAFAASLKEAGFDLFLTANNHTLDRRDKGLTTTIDILDSLSVDHIGTYKSVEARDSLSPLIKDINGFKIGFINYTYGTNGFKPGGNVVVNYIDKDLISSEIAKAREYGAEIVCATIHWGDEYKSLPNSSQRKLAEYLKNQGVELIIGTHPHVVQPIELCYNPTDSFDRNVIAYSLGNFISNMKTADTRGGTLLQVRLIRDLKGKARIVDARYIPVYTVPAANKFNFYLIPATQEAPRHAEYNRQVFLNRLIKLFSKYNRNTFLYINQTE